ncbi:hypothetical protein FHU30_003716 [Actinomadura rupiterrae]|nr:hypothetical protein [Actinomadura rupiterrae]
MTCGQASGPERGHDRPASRPAAGRVWTSRAREQTAASATTCRSGTAVGWLRAGPAGFGWGGLRVGRRAPADRPQVAVWTSRAREQTAARATTCGSGTAVGGLRVRQRATGGASARGRPASGGPGPGWGAGLRRTGRRSRCGHHERASRRPRGQRLAGRALRSAGYGCGSGLRAGPARGAGGLRAGRAPGAATGSECGDGLRVGRRAAGGAWGPGGCEEGVRYGARAGLWGGRRGWCVGGWGIGEGVVVGGIACAA